jgi:hypothetical protein
LRELAVSISSPPHGGSMPSKALEYARELIGRRSDHPRRCRLPDLAGRKPCPTSASHRTGDQRRGHQPLGAPGPEWPPGLFRRAHRRGAHRPPGTIGPATRFPPSERDGLLYGRGAADMKGSIAAFPGRRGGFSRRPSRPCRLHRLADHLRRGRSGRGRHGEGGGGSRHATSASTPASSASRPASPLRRHHEERPARFAARPAARQGHPGPHRLSAVGQKPHPSGRPRHRRTGRHESGTRATTTFRRPPGRSPTCTAAPAPATSSPAMSTSSSTSASAPPARCEPEGQGSMRSWTSMAWTTKWSGNSAPNPS